MAGGIYIIFLSDSHYYGGRAIDFQGRWSRHLRRLKKGTHPNRHMQAVYDKTAFFEAHKKRRELTNE